MPDFYLNAMGANGTYQIYRVDFDGHPVAPASLVVSPSQSGFDARHVYWPSPISVGGSTYIYATAEGSAGIGSIGLWINGPSGVERFGQVLAPSGDETEIGMAVVMPDTSDLSAPYKMIYGAQVGNFPRPREVRLATSMDGKTWIKTGTLYAPTHPGVAHGFQLSNVCQDVDGTWRMFYSGTNVADASKFSAFEARAESVMGPWTFYAKIFDPGGVSVAVTASLSLGTRYVPVSSTAGIVAGQLYLLGDDTSARQQRVEVAKIYSPTVVILKEQTTVAGSGLVLRSVHFNKVDPSYYYRETPQSSGRFLFTAWGSFANSTNEFVFEAEEGASGIEIRPPHRFLPFGPGNFLSYENPAAVKSNPSCVLSAQ